MTAANLGIVGVGNCASSLVQGLAFHGVDDVRVVSAFDVAPGKVGRDLAEAILAPPNNALRFADVGALGVTVRDDSGVADALRESGTDVVVSLLPTGAQQETKAAGMAAEGPAVPAHVATSYIPHLADRKTAYIRVDALGFGATPIEIDVRMSLEDSPSAAPVVLAAVRAAKAALAAGRGGVLDDASARLMKAPPRGGREQ